MPFEIPEDAPPAVKNALEWAADKLEHVSIPGFIAPPVPEDVELPPPPPPLIPGTDSQWVMPIKAEAYNEIGQFLAPGEPLIGAIYLRGTADWRTWRKLIIGGIVLHIAGALLNFGPLSVLGTIAFIYLIIQGIRIWKGKQGQYYAGFTPSRLILLPLNRDLVPQADHMEDAPWDRITRLRLTGDYAWIEAAGADGLTVMAVLPAQGVGDLGRQRKWLFRSPITTMLREKGFDIRDQ